MLIGKLSAKIYYPEDPDTGHQDEARLDVKHYAGGEIIFSATNISREVKDFILEVYNGSIKLAENLILNEKISVIERMSYFRNRTMELVDGHEIYIANIEIFKRKIK